MTRPDPLDPHAGLRRALRPTTAKLTESALSKLQRPGIAGLARTSVLPDSYRRQNALLKDLAGQIGGFKAPDLVSAKMREALASSVVTSSLVKTYDTTGLLGKMNTMHGLARTAHIKYELPNINPIFRTNYSLGSTAALIRQAAAAVETSPIAEAAASAAATVGVVEEVEAGMTSDEALAQLAQLAGMLVRDLTGVVVGMVASVRVMHGRHGKRAVVVGLVWLTTFAIGLELVRHYPEAADSVESLTTLAPWNAASYLALVANCLYSRLDEGKD